MLAQLPLAERAEGALEREFAVLSVPVLAGKAMAPEAAAASRAAQASASVEPGAAE